MDMKEYKEGWVLKIGAGEDSWESLENKEIKAVNPKGNQSWIFIGRTDAEAPIVCLPDGKSWLIGKTLMLGKVEGKKRRGWQKMRWLDAITFSMDMSWNKLQKIMKEEKPVVLQFMGLQRVGHDFVTEQQQIINWGKID